MWPSPSPHERPTESLPNSASTPDMASVEKWPFARRRDKPSVPLFVHVHPTAIEPSNGTQPPQPPEAAGQERRVRARLASGPRRSTPSTDRTPGTVCAVERAPRGDGLRRHRQRTARRCGARRIEDARLGGHIGHVRAPAVTVKPSRAADEARRTLSSLAGGCGATRSPRFADSRGSRRCVRLGSRLTDGGVR